MDQLLLPGRCQYNGCTNRATVIGSGMFCFSHGGRRWCSCASCSKFAQAGGLCIKHGYKKLTCSMDGLSNQSVARGLCKRHRARCCCNVINCIKSIFKHNMCRSHYSLTNEFSTVMNNSITVSTTEPITESSTVTTNTFTVTNQSSTVITYKSSTVTNEPCTLTNEYLCTVSNKAGTASTKLITVMEIDIVIQQVMEFVGMGNWEQVHTFAAVCIL
jgi:hypothetical protein